MDSQAHEMRSVSPLSSRRFTAHGGQSDAISQETGNSSPPPQHRDGQYQPVRTTEGTESHHRQRPSLMSRLGESSWTLELLAWAVAAIALIILISVLAKFNNKPLSRWHSGISVNTLVNILTTISSLALIFPVACGIAQMRWLWVERNQRPITDIQSFGAGPLEILDMIRKHPTMLLAYFGAFNVILIVIFSPITQETVAFPVRQRDLDSSTGFMGVTHAYKATTPPTFTSFTADQDSFQGPKHFPSVLYPMAAAINEGILQTSTDPSEVSPSCSTGNCTFAPYDTLGVCANMEDISSTIVHNCHAERIGAFKRCFYSVEDLQMSPPWREDNYTAIIPDISLWLGASDVNTSSNGPYPDPKSLGTFYVIYLPDTSAYFNDTGKSYLEELVALKGSMDLCIISHETEVTNGVTKTTEQSRVTDLTWQIVEKMDSENNPISAISSTKSGEEFWMTQDAGRAFKAYLQVETFHGTSPMVRKGESESGFTTAATNMASLLVNQQNGKDGLLKFLDNMALSMTNSLRTTSDQKDTAPGAVLAPVTYIAVEFRWLILPIVSVVFALLSLLIVIFQSHHKGVPAWKTSQIIPLLSLDQSAAEALSSSSSSSSPYGDVVTSPIRRAREVKVRLEQGANKEWRLYS